MGTLARSAAVRLCAVLAAGWLLGAGAARAEGGGEDLGTVQRFLDGICTTVGQTPCPRVPTITQGFLEIAGLFNARPEAVRYGQSIPPGITVNAGNPPIVAGPPIPLSSLTPLAFVAPSDEEDDEPASGNSGEARPTRLYDPKANSFFYAVTTQPKDKQVNTLVLFYEDLLRNKREFRKGQIVADISLPLVVLSNDGTETERSVMTILEMRAACESGPACLKTYAIGDFSVPGVTETRSAADIGVTFTLAFDSSPILKHPHAIFEVHVPLVVTLANDPAYISSDINQVTGKVTFAGEELGFAPPFLRGKSIGIAPVAAPLGLPPAAGVIPSFGFCANLPDNRNGSRSSLRPAVAAFLLIGVDGEVLVSSPLPMSPPEAQCPF